VPPAQGRRLTLRFTPPSITASVRGSQASLACSLDSVTAGGQGSRPAARSAAAATYDMYTAQQTETIAHVKGLWCGGEGVELFVRAALV